MKRESNQTMKLSYSDIIRLMMHLYSCDPEGFSLCPEWSGKKAKNVRLGGSLPVIGWRVERNGQVYGRGGSPEEAAMEAAMSYASELEDEADDWDVDDEVLEADPETWVRNDCGDWPDEAREFCDGIRAHAERIRSVLASARASKHYINPETLT